MENMAKTSLGFNENISPSPQEHSTDVRLPIKDFGPQTQQIESVAPQASPIIQIDKHFFPDIKRQLFNNTSMSHHPGQINHFNHRSTSVSFPTKTYDFTNNNYQESKQRFTDSIIGLD